MMAAVPATEKFRFPPGIDIPYPVPPEKLYEGAAALPLGANSGKLGVPPPVFIIALMI